LQDPSTYSISGTALNFSAAPPAGTGNISVRFLGIPASGVVNTAYRTQTEFTATAGQTTFSVPSYTVGYIDVYRNGALLGSADFTATNGTTVTLAAGASAGDLIETVSFYVSSVLNAIPATAGAVTSSYILDGAVTQAKLASGVAGNGPAFFAYKSGVPQSITNSTFTKVTLNSEEYDTNNNFASSTFTPTVAGYYQISGGISNLAGNTPTRTIVSIFKNGSGYAGFGDYTASSSYRTYGSCLVYCNGSTDYIELYVYLAGSSLSVDYGTSTGVGYNTYMSGALVRAA
jgi:hypothetical protein